MSKYLSVDLLLSLQKRVDTTTPGPWVASIEGRDHPLGGESVILRGENSSELDLYLTNATDQDFDFIANARQDLPLLIKECERLLEKEQGRKNDVEPLPASYLTEIRNRAENATQGPWIPFLEGRDFENGRSYIQRGPNGSSPNLYFTDASEDDVFFIAHAREDIPFLLYIIEKFRK